MKIDKNIKQDDDTISIASMADDTEVEIEQEPDTEDECSEIGKLIIAYFYGDYY